MVREPRHRPNAQAADKFNLGKLNEMRFSSLVREATFAVTATCNARSRTKLLAATVRFHIANKMAKTAIAINSSPFDIDIQLGDKPLSVRIRQHSGDLFIFYEVLAFQAYALAPTFLPPDDVLTIVDCGANIGMTSLYFSQCYPRARIFAVEAEPSNYELLKHNTASIDRIVPIEGAIVGHPRTSVNFDTARPAWGNGILKGPPSARSVKVSAITLNQLMEQHAIEHIDLLKIDIEGGEVEVFNHPQFLSKVGVVAIELHGEYSIEKFREAISPFGFRADPPGTYPGVNVLTARRQIAVGT